MSKKICNIDIINKAVKKVNLDLGRYITYDISYDRVRDVYLYKECIVEGGVDIGEEEYELKSLAEVKNTLGDICGHYGNLDYVIYNNDKKVKGVIIDKTTNVL